MFKVYTKVLPWSTNRYKVTGSGKILDNFDKEIKPFVKDNELYVNLSWVNGVDDYLVGSLILVAFKKVSLPDILVKQIQPLYKDDDFNNVSLANLIYRYKDSPLEVINRKGYYYIPMCENYALTINGDIVNLTTGVHKKWSKLTPPKNNVNNRTSGYLYTKVVNGEGDSKILYQHRALCLVFVPYDNKVVKMTCNHKDGVTDNNILSNLEWVTYSGNLKHAIDSGLRPNHVKRVVMKDLNTGKETTYSSISECARELNLSNQNVITRIANGLTKVWPDRMVFKYDDGLPWPLPVVKEIDYFKKGQGDDIIARNIFTGQELIFTGVNNGCHITGVVAGTIFKHLKENRDIPVGGYNFRYINSKYEWPIHTAKHLKIYEEYPIYPPNGVIVTDKDTGEEVEFFTSMNNFANKYPGTKQALGDYIIHKKIFQGKYLVKYFKLKESYEVQS